MALSIERANMGYDQVGLQQMIQKIHMEAIPNTCKTLASQAQNVASAIDGVWQGASAAAFKQKLEDDTNTINQMLMEISAGIVEQLHQTGANVEAYDAAIAEELFGASNVVPGNGFATDMKNLGQAIYNSNPVTKALVDGAVNIGKAYLKTQASIVNLGASVTEGILTFGENLVDGVAYVGVGLGWCGAKVYDLFAGTDHASSWLDMSVNALAPSRVKGMFDKLYSTKVGQMVDDAAWGAFSRSEGGIAYTVGKSVGEVTGNAALALVTGGSSVAVTTAAAAAAGAGKSVAKTYSTLEKNGQQHDTAMLGKALGKGYLDGAIDGAAWYLTYGGGVKNMDKTLAKAGEKFGLEGSQAFQTVSNAVGKGTSFLKNKGTVWSKELDATRGLGKLIAQDGKAVLAGSFGMDTVTKMTIQAGKAYAQEGTSVIIDGKYDVGKATSDAFVNAATAAIYDVSGVGGAIGNMGKNLQAKASATINNNGGGGDGGGGGSIESNSASPTQTSTPSYMQRAMTRIIQNAADGAIEGGIKKSGGTVAKKPVSTKGADIINGLFN